MAPPQGPPDDAAIREELRKQGIDNFGELVSQAAQRLRDRGDVDAARWFMFVHFQKFVFLWEEDDDEE